MGIAHTIGGIRGVYNRAEYGEQQRAMLRHWADMADAWRDGDSVAALRRRA